MMDQPQQKNDSTTQQPHAAETFAPSRTDVVIIGLVCLGIGVALGFFLPALGSIAAKFPIPFGDVIEKLSRFDQAWVVIARPIIGGALGLIAAFFIASSTTPLRIDEHRITIGRDDNHPLHISRASFSTAYFADGKLVVVTEGGHQAFKGDVEGKKAAIAEAFTSRGYRWGEI
ncbi:YqeB family protein [Brevibacterium linens]|uniref:YqeB family protein n=1 Tax=Brevibacterium linens TaxID=1703 RepID=UPI003BF4B660